MASNEKNQPSIALAPTPIRERLALALKDEGVGRSFSVKLKVGGGVHSQDYSLNFLATGEGRAECQFACRLTGRSGDSATYARAKAARSANDFRSLLKKMEPVVQLPVSQPRFLPDTLVGILEISDGRQVHRVYFAADPDQAKTQGLTPPRELLAAVNAIYTMGSKLTGQRSVKP